MKQTSIPQPTRHDDALLRSTLMKLTATQKIVCGVVIAIVALVWYDLLNRLIDFGRGIDYTGLHALGPRTVELLTRYNPFFWWTLVALCTLIIAYFLYGFVRGTQRKVQSKLVSTEVVSALVSELSEPAKEVLCWVWQDRRDPLTVGDLQRTAFELRADRAHKINLAREHAAALDGAPDLPEGNKNLQSG
jgi:hypothetical protein